MARPLDPDRLLALGVDAALIAQRERLDGQRALDFLADLPALADRWQARLGLRNLRIMAGGVLSAALACEQAADGSRAVLKLSAPDAVSAAAEAAALAAWHGAGACRLLHAADEGRAMLLEAIVPGTAVRPSGDDPRDARRVAALMTTLHAVERQRIPSAVPPIEAELRWRFDRAHVQLDGASHARGLITHEEIDAAHRDALALARSADADVLCHGDFMNKNILLDERGEWRAIDPRPCRGDPCLDAAFWALTHRPGERVAERCGLLADAAGLDPGRVRAWARAFAVSEAVLVTDAPRAHAHHSVVAAAI